MAWTRRCHCSTVHISYATWKLKTGDARVNDAKRCSYEEELLLSVDRDRHMRFIPGSRVLIITHILIQVGTIYLIARSTRSGIVGAVKFGISTVYQNIEIHRNVFGRHSH